MDEVKPAAGVDFIRATIKKDNETGKYGGRVVTRFPPEPNGYLHIGHAKSICLNFGIATEFKGRCHLRFDDTNPTKEEEEYFASIQQDVRWLGFDWGEHLYYASDYFDRLHQWALKLIEAGKAYVDELSPDQIREARGTLTTPGRDSPFRDRPIEESLARFEQMRRGEIEEGQAVLRAKIDMKSPNLNLRDPVMYRVLKTSHPRAGAKWVIYPMYDWAHGQSDSIEGITHSICTLEFEDHRPLYDWFIAQLGIHHPQQIEFARLNLTFTVLSKRKLINLVKEKRVEGWDDPRMPTISGFRRRGYTPEAIRDFAGRIGVAKADSTVDMALLEHCLREDLNQRAPRRLAVLDPIKVTITNYPEGQEETLEAVNNPEDQAAGTRMVPFSRELFIEREDFMEDPPKKFYRLAPGREVRLRYAYFIKLEQVVKDASGQAIELRCSYDPATRGGDAPDGRKVKSTLHWVSARHAVDAEVRLYDRLFLVEDPNQVVAGKDWLDHLNPHSKLTLAGAKLEPALKTAVIGDLFQLERKGYFRIDEDSAPGRLVLNRSVSLKDAWAKAKSSE